MPLSMRVIVIQVELALPRTLTLGSSRYVSYYGIEDISSYYHHTKIGSAEARRTRTDDAEKDATRPDPGMEIAWITSTRVEPTTCQAAYTSIYQHIPAYTIKMPYASDAYCRYTR